MVQRSVATAALAVVVGCVTHGEGTGRLRWDVQSKICVEIQLVDDAWCGVCSRCCSVGQGGAQSDGALRLGSLPQTDLKSRFCSVFRFLIKYEFKLF